MASPRLLQPLPIPKSIFSEISMDFVGLLKSGGKNVIMMVVDRLTKYSHFIALVHPFTMFMVEITYLDYIYKLHGNLYIIVSDRSPTFVSRFW